MSLGPARRRDEVCPKVEGEITTAEIPGARGWNTHEVVHAIEAQAPTGRRRRPNDHAVMGARRVRGQDAVKIVEFPDRYCTGRQRGHCAPPSKRSWLARVLAR